MCEFIQICRVCLEPSPTFVEFDTPLPTERGKAENLTYLQCFRMSTQIMDIQSHENMCETCAKELQITFEFLEKAKRAEQILQGFNKSTEHHDVIEIGEPSVDSHWHEEESEAAVIVEHHGDQEHEEANGTWIEDVIQENVITMPLCDYITKTYEEDVSLDNANPTPTTYVEYENDAQEFENPPVNEDFSMEDYEEDADDPGSPESIKPTTFKCYDCNAIFSSLAMRRRHQWRCHKIMVTCRICLQDVPINDSMLNHMLRTHAHHRKCKHCEFVGRDDKVVIHERTVHETDTQYECKLCEKSFSYLTFVSHLRRNCRRQQANKSDACEICGKTFSTKSYLRQHMEVHLQKREVYACSQCDKRYLTKNSLDIHMRVHAGKTLKCSVCSKTFTRSYELRVHMRFHTGEFPFECDVCHKRFAIQSHVRAHMWIHQGVKTQCDECGKLFGSTKALHEHSFVHTGMPYPCAYCKSSFPTKQKIKKHLGSVHKVKMDDDELDRLMKGASQPVRRKKVTLVQPVDEEVEDADEPLLGETGNTDENVTMDEGVIDEVV